MQNQLVLNEYKQAVADFYDRRSQGYDDGEWRTLVCRHLLEYSPVSVGQRVLDIGTGTGYLAIASAQVVKAQGRVVGVDISPKMLQQAQNKIDTLGLNNVQLQLADAEALDYPSDYFDHVLCANTFPWMKDKSATLRLWHEFLKTGGRIAVHTPADTAYVGVVVLRSVLAKHGFELEASNRIGSIEQCRELFENAGFDNVEIKTERHGGYTTLEKAKTTWDNTVVNPSITSLKVFHNGLSQLSPVQLAQIKSEFDAALTLLSLAEG